MSLSISEIDHLQSFSDPGQSLKMQLLDCAWGRIPKDLKCQCPHRSAHTFSFLGCL